MREERSSHIVDLLFAVALFGVFAISALLVVYMGARIYETTTNDMTHNFTSRTAVSYIREKMRHSDMENSVSIKLIDDIPTISLSSVTEDGIRYTYINSYAGYLEEANMETDALPERKDYSQLMELQSFSIRQVATGVYYVTVVDKSGESDFAYISTKSDQNIKGSAVAAPTE